LILLGERLRRAQPRALSDSVGFRLTESKQNQGLTSFCQFVRPATALTVPFENKTVAVATKTFTRFLLFAAFVGAPLVIYAQGVDPTVEIPTTAHKSALIEIPAARQSVTDANADDNVTMAGEYKSTKNVVEEQKQSCWDWAVDVEYRSEYNFRGTNLTPGDNAGAISMDAEVTKWNFTAGVFVIRQLGKAQANSWSMGESGGGGSVSKASFFGFPLDFQFTPETTQRSFDEIDVFLNYHLSLNWVDLTVGNVGFFIHRKVETEVLTNIIFLGKPLVKFEFPGASIGEDEQFDRLFARLSTSKIPYVTPSVTFYQTIHNNGQDRHALATFDLFRAFGATGPLERNDELGGYLEGKLHGHFPVTSWLAIDPYGVASVSFHDRTEPINNPQTLKDAIRGHTLSGWNVAQAGLELPIRLVHFVGNSSVPCAAPDVTVYLVPSGWYSYHISDPTPGTDRNEAWGGVKFTVTF